MPSLACVSVFSYRPFPAVRHHEHVEAGVERLRAVVVGATRHLTVAVPVAHREAVGVHALLEHVGHQALVAGASLPFQLENEIMTVCTPASMAGTSPRCGCRAARFRGSCVDLFAAVLGTAVREEVFGGGDHVLALGGSRRCGLTLETLHERAGDKATRSGSSEYAS